MYTRSTMTASGWRRSSSRPATRFQGPARPEFRSKPTSMMLSSPPSGFFQGTNCTTSRSACATPGTERARIELALVHRQGDLEVLRALGDDPEIRVGVADDDGGGVGEAQKESELHGDQHHGEDDADQGDDEAGAIVGQVAPSEQPGHGRPPGTAATRSRLLVGKRASALGCYRTGVGRMHIPSGPLRSGFRRSR